MKFTVGVTAHNLYLFGRVDVFRQTLASLEKAFPKADKVVVFTATYDGSASLTPEGWEVFQENEEPPGAGRRTAVQWAAEQDADMCIFSDDDMVWDADVAGILENTAGGWPRHLALLGGMLEPEYHWNKPIGTTMLGDHPALLRESVPGAAWICPREKLSRLEPLIKPCFGYDTEACKGLRLRGKMIGAMDLTRHVGWECTTHNNRMDQAHQGKPLDKEKWGL